MPRARLLGALGLACSLAACDLGTITVPRTVPSVVVHAVLNTAAGAQVVLLERTLTGAFTVSDSGFDSSDPIVSGGGVPIDSAVVEITDPSGVTTTGLEQSAIPADSGKGRGMYLVQITGNQLIRGGRYRLHVHTPAGEDVIAFTRVPNADVTSFGGITTTFNRDHDTLHLSWNRAGAARTYYARIESPFGPFFLFTDSVSLNLAGDLRNPFSDKLQHMFIPGFRQDALVAAVDSNFYDYYRTNNDPFTGSGIISRVQGGIGLFGAVAILNTGTINVVADQTDPIEGRFRASAGNAQSTVANRITLYIESKAARAGLPDALSGQYQVFGNGGGQGGLIGERSGDKVVLALLRAQRSADTADVFVGTLHGDTLSGAYRGLPGPVMFVRIP